MVLAPPQVAPSSTSRNRLPLVVGGVAVLAVGAGIAAWLLLGNAPQNPVPTVSPSLTLLPSPTGPEPIGATVIVDSPVTPTGVACTAGRVLSLTASGELSVDGRTAGPDGAAGWFDEAAPVRRAPLEALLGRVDADWFFVGDTLTLVCPGDGELMLGTNSLADTDPSGSLTVELSSRDDLSADDLGTLTLIVPATESWVDSGFACTAGQQFRVSATGIAGAVDASPTTRGGPDGVRLRDGAIVPGAALRTAAHRALLGRVGEGEPFLLGSSATLRCPTDGVLALQVNDGVLEDNTGEFSVTLTRWQD